MSRPPGRNNPHIFFSRPANEQINIVSHKHKQLAELQLSDEEKAAIKNWTEAEFVCAALKLERIDAPRERVARLIAAAPDDSNEAGEPEQLALALLRAFQKIEQLAETSGREAQLTPEILVTINSLATNDSGFRKSSGDANQPAKAIPAEHLRAVVESACLWYAAESFAELNPVEQSAIVLLRLAEIQPFERGNLRTALVAASLFTIRSGLPPVIVNTEDEALFFGALDEGRRMNTQPLVESIAAAIVKTLGQVIDQISKRRSKR